MPIRVHLRGAALHRLVVANVQRALKDRDPAELSLGGLVLLDLTAQPYQPAWLTRAADREDLLLTVVFLAEVGVDQGLGQPPAPVFQQEQRLVFRLTPQLRGDPSKPDNLGVRVTVDTPLPGGLALPEQEVTLLPDGLLAAVLGAGAPGGVRVAVGSDWAAIAIDGVTPTTAAPALPQPADVDGVVHLTPTAMTGLVSTMLAAVREEVLTNVRVKQGPKAELVWEEGPTAGWSPEAGGYEARGRGVLDVNNVDGEWLNPTVDVSARVFGFGVENGALVARVRVRVEFDVSDALAVVGAIAGFLTLGAAGAALLGSIGAASKPTAGLEDQDLPQGALGVTFDTYLERTDDLLHVEGGLVAPPGDVAALVGAVADAQGLHLAARLLGGEPTRLGEVQFVPSEQGRIVPRGGPDLDGVEDPASLLSAFAAGGGVFEVSVGSVTLAVEGPNPPTVARTDRVVRWGRRDGLVAALPQKGHGMAAMPFASFVEEGSASGTGEKGDLAAEVTAELPPSLLTRGVVVVARARFRTVLGLREGGGSTFVRVSAEDLGRVLLITRESRRLRERLLRWAGPASPLAIPRPLVESLTTSLATLSGSVVAPVFHRPDGDDLG